MTDIYRLDRGFSSWNLGITRVFNDSELEEVNNLFVLLQNQQVYERKEDKVRWKLERRSIYLVKFSYEMKNTKRVEGHNQPLDKFSPTKGKFLHM